MYVLPGGFDAGNGAPAMAFEVGDVAQQAFTGSLPEWSEVESLVEAAYRRCKADTGGGVADYIPVLAQTDLDQVNFSNDQLRDVRTGTDASDAEVDAAVQINTDARLRALRLGLLILAGASALAILPAARLPAIAPARYLRTWAVPLHLRTNPVEPWRLRVRAPARSARGWNFAHFEYCISAS